MTAPKPPRRGIAYEGKTCVPQCQCGGTGCKSKMSNDKSQPLSGAAPAPQDGIDETCPLCQSPYCEHSAKDQKVILKETLAERERLATLAHEDFKGHNIRPDLLADWILKGTVPAAPVAVPANFVSDYSLPSCHVCGEMMKGVCPKCGTTTGVAVPAGQDLDEQFKGMATDEKHQKESLKMTNETFTTGKCAYHAPLVKKAEEFYEKNLAQTEVDSRHFCSRFHNMAAFAKWFAELSHGDQQAIIHPDNPEWREPAPAPLPPPPEPQRDKDGKPTLPVGVSVLVTDAQGRLLLGKRKNNSGVGLLSTPGGRIEQDENMIATAIRETREETGLTLAEEDLEVIAFKELFRFGNHYIMFYVHARQFSGEVINVEPDKCEGWQWLTLDEIELDKTTEPSDVIQALRVKLHPAALAGETRRYSNLAHCPQCSQKRNDLPHSPDCPLRETRTEALPMCEMCGAGQHPLVWSKGKLTHHVFGKSGYYVCKKWAAAESRIAQLERALTDATETLVELREQQRTQEEEPGWQVIDNARAALRLVKEKTNG